MSDTESDSSSDSGSEVGLSPVLEWYSKLNSRRVDIVGDYAGNELFLVLGEALLLHCFSDEHIDFDPNFQLLHATYAVESFLGGLVARRCNFHIAFFNQHRQLCVPHWVTSNNREKYLLAREAVIRHLQVNLKAAHSDVEIHVFPSINSPAFAKYMEETDLYFVMCHDGASSGAPRKRKMPARDLNGSDEEEAANMETQLKIKTMFRLVVYWFLDRGYNAALVNGLEWRDTKVMATVLESIRHTKHEDFAQMVHPLLQ